jgi:nucleotide-binding universal stress UspA family protein
MKHYRIRRILVPLDFSPLSLHGLYHAERLAKLTKSRITLLNVVEQYVDTISVDAGTLVATMKMEQRLQAENSEALTKLAGAAARRTRLKVDAKVFIGKPSAEITRTAETEKSDLIIMSTHGASGFIERLLGSTTYRVATLSKIPVLSVHKLPRYGGFANVIYPVRQRTNVMNKFPHALAFATLFSARVHVIGQVSSANKQHFKRIQQLCVRITTRFAQHGLTTKSVLSSDENFARAVAQYAGTHPGSLVVIMQDYDFRLADLFKGSFTKRVLHKMLSPVLAIPTHN